MQILVRGRDRSGTSVVTRLLNAAGAFVWSNEELLVPLPDNPTGYWERYAVCALNDAILDAVDARWDTATGDEVDQLSPSQRHRFAGEIRDLVHALDEHQPWVVKDPRLSVTFPMWRGLLDRPLCVVCHRDPGEVAMSLRNRDGLPLEIGAALWDAYTVAALRSTEGVQRIFLAYDQLLDQPVDVMDGIVRKINEMAGRPALRLDDTAIDTIVRSDLRRSRVDDRESAIIVNPFRATLLDRMRGGLNATDRAGHDRLPLTSSDSLKFYRDRAAASENSGVPVVDRVEELRDSITRVAEELGVELPNPTQLASIDRGVSTAVETLKELGRAQRSIVESAEASAASESATASQLQSILEGVRQVHQRFESQLEALRTELQELHASRAEIGAKLELVVSERDHLADLRDQLQGQNSELQGALARATHESSLYEDRANRAGEAQRELVARLVALEQVHASLRDLVSTNTNRLETLHATAERTEAQNNLAAPTLTRLESQLGSIRETAQQQADAAAAIPAALQDLVHASLEPFSADRIAELQSARQAMADARAESVELQREVDRRQSWIAQLEDGLVMRLLRTLGIVKRSPWTAAD